MVESGVGRREDGGGSRGAAAAAAVIASGGLEGRRSGAERSRNKTIFAKV